MVDCVEKVRFVWRLGATGKMELSISWRKQPELDTIIFFYDNTFEREVVVGDASSFTFFEADEPAIFSASFTGFQLYNQVPYGVLQGVQSIAVHFTELVPEVILFKGNADKKKLICRSADRHALVQDNALHSQELVNAVASMREVVQNRAAPKRNKRVWCEDDCQWPGWKCAKSSWQDKDWKDYPWRQNHYWEAPRNRRACLFHDPAVGKHCRNNRLHRTNNV